MQFNGLIDPKARASSDCAVIAIYEGGDLGLAARQIDQQSGGRIKAICTRGDFAGRLGDTLLLTEIAGCAATRIMLVGLGARGGYARKQYRKALQSAAQAVAKTGAREAIVYLSLEPLAELDAAHRSRTATEAFAAQAYKIPDLKTGNKPKPAVLNAVRIAAADARTLKATDEGAKAGTAIAAGAAFARDLSNLPPNICTPRFIATRAQELAKQWRSLSAKVLDENDLKALKMGAFLAVSQGSDEPPRLVILEYHGGRKGAAPICLVGKGITFDSGGISLKDPPGMDEMKFDMSGAAAIMGAMRTVAELKLPINVIAIVAAAENMPSGRAVKPSDIVTTMSGQTVEILNTDAEGRLVLCDALTYARRYKPATVVDVATLTGACIVALGNHVCGLMSNDDALARELESAGQRADDRCWRLPIGEEYVDQLKSNFADMANVGGREGGACTAASFLSKFTKDLSWAHLDVAGVAWLNGAQKQSTGRPVPLLVDFLLQRARNK